MDVSLAALRERLLNFRAWDSTGATFDKRVREALNTALDRMAGDVPEALIPEEQHVVLFKDEKGEDNSVRLASTADGRVLRFTTTAGAALGAAPAWSPTIDGTWDGLMHLEVKDPAGVWHRRQSCEFWQNGTEWYVSIDRAWQNATDTLMDFRIHQPEFFVSENVMEVLQPGKIWDGGRQQVWAIDTAGAYRQDMFDYQGDSTGRPFRLWRGRHFKIPAPKNAPKVTPGNTAGGTGTTPWAGPEFQGRFKFCYTYVWGRRTNEWQISPGGTLDPQWESAPSPVVTYEATSLADLQGSIVVRGADIDAMTDFNVAGSLREGHSGFRVRFYVARESVKDLYTTSTSSTNLLGEYDNVETAGVFYLLAEIEPTAQIPNIPSGLTTSYEWDGSQIPDYYRPLRHSTGYYGYKVYPHQDDKYELDLRVLALPRKYIADTDTAPIQRDAVSALLELSLYYMSLLDGVDQQSAMLHLKRYEELARRFRRRYANTGGSVAPVPLGGYITRARLGRFRNSN
tara:strand:+ start:4152 stop:5687 length:1536 start_codon:yes stop_codon:yes gene_type:complete